MAKDDRPRGPDPRHALLRERMKAYAEAESVRARARQWRDKTDEERVRAFVELFDMSVLVNNSRERPYRKPPLNYPRFGSVQDDGAIGPAEHGTLVEMSEERAAGSDPRHALLRERMKAYAEAESVRARAREWRGKSQEERVRAFVEIMRNTAWLLAARPEPYEKPPLAFPRFSSRPRNDDD